MERSTSSLPRSSSTQDLRAPVKLYANMNERSLLESKSDLFSIITCIELLEKAYIKDALDPKEYTSMCEKLLAQYKTVLNMISVDLEAFVKEYQMNVPAALKRLRIGLPATVEHSVSGSNDSQTKYVAETVQLFITLMDSLKLNMIAVDQIHPLLSDLITSINKVNLPSDYTGKELIKSWLITLNKLKASDELSEDQIRQLMFDLEKSHNGFYKCLSEMK